jgi:hypothetical protein
MRGVAKIMETMTFRSRAYGSTTRIAMIASFLQVISSTALFAAPHDLLIAVSGRYRDNARVSLIGKVSLEMPRPPDGISPYVQLKATVGVFTVSSIIDSDRPTLGPFSDIGTIPKMNLMVGGENPRNQASVLQGQKFDLAPTMHLKLEGTSKGVQKPSLIFLSITPDKKTPDGKRSTHKIAGTLTLMTPDGRGHLIELNEGFVNFAGAATKANLPQTNFSE